jgi:hypothetical protein
MARLVSGALITMNGCGRAIPSIGSDIRVFCELATFGPACGANGSRSSATAGDGWRR